MSKGKIKEVKRSKWYTATDLKGRQIMVCTIWEKNVRTGKTFSRRIAYRQAV